MHNTLFALLGLSSLAHGWLPSNKMRGVNLGSLFIMEPWMASNEWAKMGCNGLNSEFDCVEHLGQSEANTVFQEHWDTWITEDDIKNMTENSINTIRVPVGYWMNEALVYANESFPQGGLKYLQRLCGWASDYGLYIIIDLHGAPGAQVVDNPFTGKYVPVAGFYETSQYERAYEFLKWMTNLTHTVREFRNVGMLEVLNEPASGHPTLISEYYPAAYKAIRDTEASISNLTKANYFHIQFMDTAWGAGAPKTDLPNDTFFAAFDTHRYVAFNPSVGLNQSAYLKTSCEDDAGSDGDTPVVVGEWSNSVEQSVQASPQFQVNNDTNIEWYRQWSAAQMRSYEKQLGWIFWSWKAELGEDFRWDYTKALERNVIPQNLSDISTIGGC